jgi:putative hydrolase of the HAD superfamily
MNRELAAPYLHPLKPIPTAMRPRGRLRPPIKCLLCDIYGTLFISASGDIGSAGPLDRRSAQIDQLLSRYGHCISAEKVLQRLHRTIRNFHAVYREQGVDYPEVVIETVWEKVLAFDDSQSLRKFAVEFEMIVNPVWPMPGLEKLLEHCRKYGIALGIISNAQFFTPYLFEWLLQATPVQLGFDAELTWYSYRHGYAKPSPALFQKALQMLANRGIAPRHVAFIGNDMRNDIQPARQTGFQTILFAGDSRSLRLRADDPLCKDLAPDRVVIDLNQLIPGLR